MKCIVKLIRSKPRIKIVALAIPFALSACGPWGIGSEPDPVDLGSVATSEIEVHPYGTIDEESDSFYVVAQLLNSDRASLFLDAGSSLEFQTIDDLGMYRSLDIAETIMSVDTTEYSAPATYRLMLNRSNGEEVELFNFLLKAKFKSNSTVKDTTFGNGDVFEFDWGFYVEDTMLDIYPEGGLEYFLECGNERFSGYMNVERNSGIKASPFLVNIDEIILQNSPTEFPCMATFSRYYYLTDAENSYKILAGDTGSSTSEPRQFGNGDGFNLNVNPKKYKIVINSD